MGFALASANPSMMLQFSWLDELLWYSQPHFYQLASRGYGT